MRLRAFERRWVALVSETMLPADAVAGFPGASAVPWGPFLDDFAASAPSRMLAGVRLALWFVFLLGPLVALGRLRTFAGLSGDERLRLLRALRESRFYVVRELPVLLKSVVCLAYCALPAVRRRMGLSVDEGLPPWLGEPPAR